MNLTSYIIFSCTQDPFPNTITALICPPIRQWLVLHNITCKRRVILWSILVGVINLVIRRKRVRYETENASLTRPVYLYMLVRSFKGGWGLQYYIINYISCSHPHSCWSFINPTNYYPGKAIMHSWSWLKALFQPMFICYQTFHCKSIPMVEIVSLTITKYIRILHFCIFHMHVISVFVMLAILIGVFQWWK